MTDNLLLLGLLGSLAAGSMTAAGALPMLLRINISKRAQDAMLGFAAGVMIAASFFSLLVPSLETSERLYGPGALPGAIAVAGFMLGVIVMALANRWIPHRHFHTGSEGPGADKLRRIWLFVFAITIHNFPEGMAVGIGFGSGDVANGIALMTGIGLQNAPEGLAVAVALGSERYSRGFAFMVAAMTGMVEPIGGLLGAAAVSVSQPVLPWGLAFAAGAMMYVISHEIIPETHSRGNQNLATGGLAIGLAIMMFLDVTLG